MLATTNEFYDYKRFNCDFSTITNTVIFYYFKDGVKIYYDPVSQTFFDSKSYFRFLTDISMYEPYQNRSPESMVSAIKYQFNKFNNKKYVIPFKSYLNKCAAQVRYESLEGTEEDKTVSLSIPVKLTDELIYNALINYKENYDNNFEYCLEHAKAFIGIVTHEYMYHKAKRKNKLYLSDKDFFENNHKSFVQLKSNYIEKLIGYTFESYRLAFIHAGLLLCDDKWYHYEDNKKARSYKLANELFDTEASTIDTKQYYKFNVTNWRLKYTFALNKLELQTKRKLKDKEYKQMIDDVITLFNTMNTSEMLSVYNANPFEYYGLSFGDDKGLKKKLKDKNEIKIDEFIKTVEHIQQGNTYFNVCDRFGGRFHSIFTNMKSWARQFINYNGVKYISADAKNSQMAIFSMLIEHPDAMMNMMYGTEWLNTKGNDGKVLLPFADVMQAIKHAKQHSDKNEKDLDKFVELSKSGMLYEEIASIIKKDRTGAKGCVFKTFFGNDVQFLDLKTKISTTFPTVMGLVSYLNDKNYVPHLPKVLQKVESELFINRIYKRFMKVKKYPALTIHDSVMFHPDDLDAFNEVYYAVFAELGIPPMVLKYDDYNV